MITKNIRAIRPNYFRQENILAIKGHPLVTPAIAAGNSMWVQ